MIKRFFIGLVKGYQYLISPLLGQNCRYTPTCSQYSIQAIEKYGIFKGIWLSMKRILRCRPGCSCGIDPLPKTKG